jgi:hypothetical protein
MQERSSKNADNDMKVLDRESIKNVASELEKLHLRLSYSDMAPLYIIVGICFIGLIVN